MAKHGEWDQLVSKKIDPLSYLSSASFEVDYLAVSVLSKAQFLRTSFDRRQAAVEAFWAAESACSNTNERISLLEQGLICPLQADTHGVLHRAREWLLRTLGASPSSLAKQLDPSRGVPYRFGPGVTTLVKGEFCGADKYTRRVDVSPALYPFWRDVAGPRWAAHVEDVSLRASNKVTFVPKNAKTHRTIAVEPHVNGYAQLGIAELLRIALRRAGIDLATQADNNRSLAGVAESLDLVTIDLKAASDTVSRSVIWNLLPEAWAALLDTIRSPYGDLDGVEFEYAKFSSMGNGCTFELETLLFLALVRASGSKVWAVFGDDIICERSVASTLQGALAFLGFTVNVEKTFLDGPFRESCGYDYFHGVNVRPFFWKELDVTLWWKIANDLRSLSFKFEAGHPCRRALQRIVRECREDTPRALRCLVPEGYGSFGLESNPPIDFDSVASRVSHLGDDARGFDGFSFQAVTFRPKNRSVIGDYQAYLRALDGFGYDGTGEISFRKSGSWKKVRLYSLGVWPKQDSSI